ncbi:hypothetical protein A3J41_02940 [candidate division TM6 bacterium RIFCSPHIGHO2_12_FULL_38_8]|nr:MAG: hypothetical protein A3J41_02940 [candidate division TM6 bacterium RIFCSPHIGHO2_12_FULL_38_8]
MKHDTSHNGSQTHAIANQEHPIFSGNLYIFSAFDIGFDIDFKSIKQFKEVRTEHVHVSKFFKHYHLPLEIELFQAQADSSRCVSSKIHQFGAVSLTYKIPITDTLPNLRTTIIKLDEKYQKQGVNDAYAIYKKIKPFIVKPNFYHLKSTYSVIQLNVNKDITGAQIKSQYGHDIATLLRFETESLSDFQKEIIVASSIGYFTKDLIIVDNQAAFIYDPQYKELLDFFELGNIQQLELHYFDKLLDKQLATLYERKTQSLPLLSYMPFIGSRYFDPIGDLNKLKVDISVITERLESSIKLGGETYFSEIYNLIIKQLDIRSWQKSIDKKLNIIKEIRYVYQNKVDANREDLISILIITLIMIEVGLALLK